MNLLFFTHAEPKFLPNVLLDREECICSPFYTNWRKGDLWKYINTPQGAFDASPILKKLPESQSPDIILVHADASGDCIPHNLPSTKRRVLLVGGATHFLKNPLQSILSYALKEDFDEIFVWNRHNAHFFRQFGFQNVYWMPGLIFAIPSMAPAKERRNQMCFFGQLGAYHPRRNRIIKELQQRKIPLVGGKIPRQDSLELASRSLVSLNITLNGEWNLRVFESTAMGALLLTDRVSDKTGLQHFYKDGESMMFYDDIEDLIKKIVEISKNPDVAKTIAAKGKKTTDEFFSFEARHKAFFALLNGDEAPEPFRLEDEPRCQLPAVEEDFKDSLILRVQFYEFLQELHRTEETLMVNLTEGVHPLLLSDASDLVRLKQQLFIDPSEFSANWQSAMDELKVSNLQNMEPHTLQASRGQVLVTSLADLQKETVQQIIQQKRHVYLVISDWFTDPDERYEEVLNNMGYNCLKEKVFGLFKVAEA